MTKKMSPLFEIPKVKTEDDYATEFIGKLQKMEFVAVNMVYLVNYIDADISIALSHIKEGYKKYVSTNKWSEEKYLHVVLVIARDRQMMIPGVFLKYGAKYDEGKLKREVSSELMKHSQAVKKAEESNEDSKRESNSEDSIVFSQESESKREISKEEQELLDYIAQNGGM